MLNKATPADLKRERKLAGSKRGRAALLAEMVDRLPVLANQLGKPGNLCEPGDLVSVGYLAMQAAMERWKPRPGIPFWAYAKPSVRSAMVRALMGAATPQPVEPIEPDMFPASPAAQSTVLDALTSTQRRVVEMRLLQRPIATERETCKVLGLTRDEVRVAMWEALESLKEFNH
jgi:DNA-directed RNA polymerase sigma subunit (sigma70/sigma32)